MKKLLFLAIVLMSAALQAEIKRKIMSIPLVKPGHMGGTPKESTFKLPFTF